MFDETRFTRGYCSPVRLRFGSRFGSMSILAAPCKGINVFDVLPFRKFDSVQINLVRIKLSEDVQTKWDFCIQVKKTNHLSFMCMCIYIYIYMYKQTEMKLFKGMGQSTMSSQLCSACSCPSADRCGNSPFLQ